MPSYEALRDRLPTLYRPDDDDTSLLPRFLKVVAALLEGVSAKSTDVLQAHWFTYADSALYSPYLRKQRALAGKLLLSLASADDRKIIAAFPYIDDLARLAALIPLPPWQEPPETRETVEEYRERIARIVALYSNGLGTLEALRRMVEAQLPQKATLPPARQDRSFTLEEFAPLVMETKAIQMPGEPLDLVGPLMRWTLRNDGLASVTPTLYIQGVAPVADTIDATVKPLIERMLPEEAGRRVALGYDDTLLPGKTLRLRPAYRSWLAPASGLQGAESLPTEDHAADPTAPGPWAVVEGAPDGTVAALLATPDNVLWAAVNKDGAGELHRFDGKAWAVALAAQPLLHCLLEEGQNLLLGTETGVLRLAQYPAEGAAFAAEAVAGIPNAVVHALTWTREGQLWMATDQGASPLTPDAGNPGGYLVQPSPLQGFAVYAIHQDATGTLLFGTASGLFLFQSGLNAWYVYAGGERTEQARDWNPFAAGPPPPDASVFLPPVHCVHRSSDASLWIGTEHGLARYVARRVDAFAYDTYLEAFPDLAPGSVTAIEEDAHGVVWFCTDRGLFRYDGRDMEHFEGTAWVGMGRADTLYEDNKPPQERAAWRYLRAAAQWQRFDPLSNAWINWAGAPRTTAEPVLSRIYWTDTVVADLGQWDGAHFTSPEPVAMEKLVMRVKPGPTRIVMGGMPVIPRLPVGASTWRYLSREPEPLEEPPDKDKPAYTIEGRLLPPPLDREAGVGRYDQTDPPPESDFGESVFAFNPAARIWFGWQARRPLVVLARLRRNKPDETLDPAILDRVWEGIEKVRPAGVRMLLAVEETIVRPQE